MPGRIAALAIGLPLLVAQPSTDFREDRRLWEEARTAARADPAAALPRYDLAVAAAPGNSRILLSAIGAAMRAKDAGRLAPWLARFAALGGGLDADDLAAAREILEPRADRGVMARLAANLAPAGKGEVVATIGADLHLIEGVAVDTRRGGIFVTSVGDRRVEHVDAEGRRRMVLTLSVADGYPLGLARDARRGTLWVAIDASPFGETAGAGGLIRLGADGAAERIRAGDGGSLHIGDVTAGPDGTAYAADSRSGAVYRCAPGCRALAVLVPPGRLRSAQGMAVSVDGRRLWVADYAYGLLSVDLASGATTRVRTATGVALDSIDGLALRGGRLVAVQNGWAPARLIEIRLDRAGTTATGVTVLARGGTLAEEPTQIAVSPQGALMVVANSQWSGYEKGRDAGRAVQRATRIMRLRDVRPRRS